MRRSVADDMRLVRDVCDSHSELRAVLRNPTVAKNKKLAIVNALFESRVCQVSICFLRFVLHKNRVVNISGIASRYLEMYRQAENMVLATFTTALPVGDEERQMAMELVKKSSGCDVELVSHVNPAIIGGFAIEYNDRMFDARISTKLAEVRRSFRFNDYEARL